MPIIKLDELNAGKAYQVMEEASNKWAECEEKEIILDDCVRINKVKTFKPSNRSNQDGIITTRKRGNTFVVRVSELSDKRLGFKNAISLYERIL